MVIIQVIKFKEIKTIKTVFNKLSTKDKTELATHKIELSVIDDILSEVSANGRGTDKARPLIRDAFSKLGQAIDIYERILPRNKKIEKLSDNLKTQVKELGINVSNLPTEMQNAIKGLYEIDINPDIKALKSALSSLKNTREL